MLRFPVHLMMGNMFQARAYSRLLALQIRKQPMFICIAKGHVIDWRSFVDMTELGLLDKNRAYPHDKEVKDARF